MHDHKQGAESLVEVTQVDREAAAHWLDQPDGAGWTPTIVAIRVGRRDDHGSVQAFARHRITATSEASLSVERMHQRECQAVWRCAMADFVGAMDVLKNEWVGSRRKAEREAGARLSGVLDLLWAGRDPAPIDYRTAATNGKGLIERIRAALNATAEGGER